MAVRMERGFLASAAEGPLNDTTGGRLRGVPADVGGTDVRDDEVVGTLLARPVTTSPLGSAPLRAGADVIARRRNAEREFFRPGSKRHRHRGVVERRIRHRA
jgi:hypothetical protein